MKEDVFHLSLTLWQPFATLVAIGAKTIETRSWAFPGPVPCELAIVAGGALMAEQEALCLQEPIRSLLLAAGYPHPTALPLGEVVCLVRLVRCQPVHSLKVSRQEKALGNFIPSHWGWVLDNLRPAPQLLPARGPEPLYQEEDMANLNKVMLIGRLTREPEVITFQSGGKKVSFGFAVSNRKKNHDTGNYEDDPMFIDVDAFNSQHRNLADLVAQHMHKGELHYIEGHLKMEQWQDKNGGGQRSKLKLILDQVQFLPNKDRDQNTPQPSNGNRRQRQPATTTYDDAPRQDYRQSPPQDDDMDIPF